jgi:cobalt/nickel transport system permease protein/cobalt/nickel transport protein
VTTKRFAVLGVVVALLVAGVLSFYASQSPDGLEHVAETKGFSQTETDHYTAASPFADYGTKGVDDERLLVGLAGVIGVAATGVLMGAIVLVLRRRRPAAPAESQESGSR